jgi:hypothetical protein
MAPALDFRQAPVFRIALEVFRREFLAGMRVKLLADEGIVWHSGGIAPHFFAFSHSSTSHLWPGSARSGLRSDESNHRQRRELRLLGDQMLRISRIVWLGRHSRDFETTSIEVLCLFCGGASKSRAVPRRLDDTVHLTLPQRH